MTVPSRNLTGACNECADIDAPDRASQQGQHVPKSVVLDQTRHPRKPGA
jgi:hypothetical protein